MALASTAKWGNSAEMLMASGPAVFARNAALESGPTTRLQLWPVIGRTYSAETEDAQDATLGSGRLRTAQLAQIALAEGSQVAHDAHMMKTTTFYRNAHVMTFWTRIARFAS
jgi:hypothetical protein